MAYSQTIELVQGDRLPQLTITLRDSNAAAAGRILDASDATSWATIDLTGGGAKLYFRAVGATEVKDTLEGVLGDPKAGKVTFLFNPATLDTAGTFEGEVEYTDQNGHAQTVYELIRFKVRAQF